MKKYIFLLLCSTIFIQVSAMKREFELDSGWSKLPPEIKTMIFDNVINSIILNRTSGTQIYKDIVRVKQINQNSKQLVLSIISDKKVLNLVSHINKNLDFPISYYNLAKAILSSPAFNEFIEIKKNDKNYRDPIQLAKQITPGITVANCQALIAQGADINLERTYNNTSLLFAISQNNIELVKTLLFGGADIDKVNKDGKSALILATEEGNNQILNQLVHAKPDLNIQCNQGKTALIYAVENNNPIIVKTLIEAGADVTILDKLRKSALDYSLDEKKIIADKLKASAIFTPIQCFKLNQAKQAQMEIELLLRNAGAFESIKLASIKPTIKEIPYDNYLCPMLFQYKSNKR